MVRTPLLLSALALGTLLVSDMSEAQPAVEWIRTHGGQNGGEDAVGDLVIAGDGGIYLVGRSDERPTIIQYDTEGNECWLRQIGPSHPGNLFDDAAVTDDGRVYATGHIQHPEQSVGQMITASYSADGSLIWERRYDREGWGSVGYSVGVDPNGGVLVAGVTVTALPPGYALHEDMSVLRYRQDGTLLWARHYDGPVHQSDYPTDLVVDSRGNAYVTGYGETYTWYDGVTIKYSPEGERLWVRTFDGPSNDLDYAFNVALSPDETSVYVTGRITTGDFWNQHGEWITVRYDTATGDELWAGYFGTNPDDFNGGGTDLVVDGNRTVYVVGSMEGNLGGLSANAAIAAYDSAGTMLWSVRHPRQSGEVERLGYVALSRNGSVIAAGYKPNSDNGHSDYLIVAYDLSGNELWQVTYAGPGDWRDSVGGMAIDDRGDICVSGTSATTGAGREHWDWTTIKYREEPVPVRLYRATARQRGCDVVLEWSTAPDLLGCNVLRCEIGRSAECVRVGPALIRSTDGRYLMVDDGTSCGEAYRYELSGLTRRGAYIGLRTLDVSLESEATESGISALVLHGAQPNPATESTSISFTLSEPTSVWLTFYDVSGRGRGHLRLGTLPKGRNVVVWHGSDDSGSPLASGTYYYRVSTTSGAAANGRLLLAR